MDVVIPGNDALCDVTNSSDTTTDIVTYKLYHTIIYTVSGKKRCHFIFFVNDGGLFSDFFYC